MKAIRIAPADWKATYEAIPKYLADSFRYFNIFCVQPVMRQRGWDRSV